MYFLPLILAFSEPIDVHFPTPEELQRQAEEEYYQQHPEEQPIIIGYDEKGNPIYLL